MSSTTADLHALPAPKPRRRAPAVNSYVLATLLFVGAEVMLFAGLISAFSVVKTSSVGGVWPPPGQPRLPIAQTGFNTMLLLASGALLYLAYRRFRADRSKAHAPYLLATALGALFVGLQGAEWVALIREGLTMVSSQLGSFFYLIVGMHALHAIAALLVMAMMYVRLVRGRLTDEVFAATSVFWFFVVGIWPLLYWQVYL